MYLSSCNDIEREFLDRYIGKKNLIEPSFDEKWNICVGHTIDKEVVLVLIRR